MSGIDEGLANRIRRQHAFHVRQYVPRSYDDRETIGRIQGLEMAMIILGIRFEPFQIEQSSGYKNAVIQNLCLAYTSQPFPDFDIKEAIREVLGEKFPEDTDERT